MTIAAGHRIVLGGTRFAASARIEVDVLDYLELLTTMEPSHQVYNVLGARARAAAFPGLPQVACFDSSFHRTMPGVALIYALPQDARDAGARHCGYHGISYDYISRQLPKYAPDARRVIAARLGGGASMCAMLEGAKRRDHDGFCPSVRAAYGHALGRCAHRRAVLPPAGKEIRRCGPGEEPKL